MEKLVGSYDSEDLFSISLRFYGVEMPFSTSKALNVPFATANHIHIYFWEFFYFSTFHRSSKAFASVGSHACHHVASPTLSFKEEPTASQCLSLYSCLSPSNMEYLKDLERKVHIFSFQELAEDESWVEASPDASMLFTDFYL